MHLKRYRPLSFLIATGGLITVSFLVVIYFFMEQPSPTQATPVLSVTGSATFTYPGHETTYRIELLNHTDQIVYDGVISLTLPISFTYLPSSTVVLGEGWPLESHEPQISGQTLRWGPYHLPAAGNKAHNPYGIHTVMHDCAELPLHLEGAKELVGNGGYVTQLFYGIDAQTTGPSQCAVNFVSEAYARNLIPILRLQGDFANGVWQAPDPGPDGDYGPVAQGFANFVAGLPRRDTNPLYIAVWNEPNLWIEWSGSPNATQYARFFVAVSRAIRELGDGRVRLVNGAITPGNPAFLDQMLRVPGFRDAFDAWASHCYPYNHPHWYNIHNGIARYGSYSIDCYLEELAAIKRYGRSGVKVILTETGYELGNNTFGFEGFPSINESNRASYTAGAFATYWQQWPEIIAVTPFELSDSSGHWYRFDWVYPTPPYARHPHYNAVAALPKPNGGLEPYGYQVMFKARVDPHVIPGIYTSQLRGSDRDGNTVLEPDAVPVQVYEADQHQTLYLPLVTVPPRRDGPWYLSTADAPSPGAIVPTHFLKPVGQAELVPAAIPDIDRFPLSGQPTALAVAEAADLGAVLLADGRLEIVDLNRGRSLRTTLAGEEPQAITTDAPGPAGAYVSLAREVALVDLQAGQVLARWSGAGRARGLAWDAATRRLFVADAGQERLLVLKDDLSRQVAAVSLPQQPDQLILDADARRLYLTFPAVSQLAAIDADTLRVTTQTSLEGGPLLDLAWNADRHQLYALTALAPGYRGLAVWHTPDLRLAALVVGEEEFPFRTASALAISPTGQLLIPEATGLWQIWPDRFAVRNLYPLPEFRSMGALTIDQKSGNLYGSQLPASLIRINQ